MFTLNQIRLKEEKGEHYWVEFRTIIIDILHFESNSISLSSVSIPLSKYKYSSNPAYRNIITTNDVMKFKKYFIKNIRKENECL